MKELNITPRTLPRNISSTTTPENSSGSLAQDIHRLVPALWLLITFALASPLSFSLPLDSDADLNGDAQVTSQDISILASCFGQNPGNNSDCAKADVDEDGDIDSDDFSFVSARLGQAYPEALFIEEPLTPRNSAGKWPTSIALGDVNNDDVLDVVTTDNLSDDMINISVLIGNGDGGFQAYRSYYSAVGWPESVILGDVNFAIKQTHSQAIVH
jgi:hypothetical protein